MPTPQNVHINTALTNFAVRYRPTGMIADLIAPLIPVNKMSDSFFIVDPHKKTLRADGDVRGPGGRARSTDWATGTDNYSCKEHSREIPLDDQVVANADSPLTIKQTSTEMLMDMLGLQKEIEIAALLVAGISNTSAAAAKWSENLSDPLSDFSTAKAAVRDASGKPANAAWMDRKVYDTLLTNPAILAQISGAAIATQSTAASALPGILGLQYVLVSDVLQNTSATNTPSLSTPWGTTTFVGRIEPNPNLMTQALCATFALRQALGNGGALIDEYRDEAHKSDVVRGTRIYDQKIIDAALGYRLTTCI